MELVSNIVDYVNRTLVIDRVTDYCPNGLQIEGSTEISKIVSGVTASGEFLDRAIDFGADAVLVHHGYFWRGESPVLTGMKLARVRKLLDNNIALLAYHLPLDTHKIYGNNAQLARRLGIEVRGCCAADGIDDLFWYGELSEPMPAQQWVQHVSSVLSREALGVGDVTKSLRRIGWCSGGGQRFVSQAAGLGLDAYLSGEISEQTTHEAREQDVFYVAAGHHATERYGVQALGEHLAEQFALEHRFIDVDNPA